MERLSIDEVIEHCNRTCDMTEKIAKARGHELGSIESKQFWEHYQVRNWLKELKQYREIGTLEECRAAVEKRKPKKPIVKARIPYCPCCGEIATTDTGDSYMDYRVGYCLECGQKIDLEE